MKWQLILALGGTLHRVAGLELIGEQEQDDGVICYTYLSTYLAPVDVAITGKELPTAANLPTTRGILPPYFTNRSTSLPLFTFSSNPKSSDAISKPTSIDLFSSSDFVIPSSEPSSLLPPTTATSTEASATTTGAVSGQNVILFIAPPANENRRFVKRAPGRFVGGSDTVEICTNAAVFTLADGQLLDNEDPVSYNGNPYEQFGGQGSPPDGAITREFASVNGVLTFSSRSLPGNSAGFCQDGSGQVYMTFGSSPPRCDPILIRAYAVERCQNGQIIGLDTTTTTEPNQSSTVAEPTNIASSDTETFPFDPSSAVLVVSSASTQMSQSSDLFPETIETTESSESTQISGSPTTDRVTTTSSDSSPSDLSPSDSPSSSPSTEASLFSTSIETTLPLQSSSSFSFSYTATAPSEYFSSVSTLSTDLSSSFETQSSETPSSTAVSIESSSSFSSAESSTEVSSFSFTETSSEEPTTTTDMLTTTEEPTTTTTASCNSADPLTTVALANPTPVFDDDIDHGNEFRAITIPWIDEGIAKTGQKKLYISTNGVITVDTGNNNPDNDFLTTDYQANRAFLPYWDELYLDRNKGHNIVYEIFESQFGVELVIEFILGKFDSPGIYHFEANFFQDYNDAVRFQYYTTPEKGSSATIGFQDLLSDHYAQVSYNQANVIADGSSVTIPTRYTNNFVILPFDNTECGKDQDRVKAPTDP
ncbi:hypothetical protein FAUST_11595 [Fusarium austroamericanum]|uniref:DUF7908 domain-containing protein n=1 Tax=Fusarium austroamericanum TaxID=282268 RepID=A0AAN6BV03_FUSAU|nr:hypothetical protein FAUST_11595 [Fusarium austroamericanum]